MKNVNDPLAKIIARCIKNSPDSEVKRREIQKLKEMFKEKTNV